MSMKISLICACDQFSFRLILKEMITDLLYCVCTITGRKAMSFELASHIHVINDRLSMSGRKL